MFYNPSMIQHKKLFILISMVLFTGCGLNKNTSVESSSDFSVEMIQIQPNSVRTLKYDPVWKRPLIKEIIIPVCLVNKYTAQKIVAQKFKVVLTDQVQVMESDILGCVYFQYLLQIDKKQDGSPMTMSLFVEGLGQYRGRQEIKLIIYPFSEKQVVLDARLGYSDKKSENAELDAPQLLIKDVSFTFQNQTFTIKKSLELKLNRQYGLKFQPYLLQTTDAHGEPVAKPMNNGSYNLQMIVLSNDVDLANFKQKIASCNSNCVIGAGQVEIEQRNELYADGIIPLDMFFHDFVSLSGRNTIVFSFTSKHNLFRPTYLLAQFDPLVENEQTYKLNLAHLSAEEMAPLLKTADFKLQKLNNDLAIANIEEVFVNNIKLQKDSDLMEFTKLPSPDLSFQQKHMMCSKFIDKIKYPGCIYNINKFIRYEMLEVFEAVQKQEVQPLNPEQYVIKMSVDEIYEKRFDKGDMSGFRQEHGFFAEWSLVGTVGTNIFGNGLISKGEVGVKAEDRWYYMTFESKSTSRRTRSQSNLYKEFLVDKLTFDFHRTTRRCFVVSRLDNDSKYFACSLPSPAKKVRDSYYYVSPRAINPGQVGLVDMSKAAYNFRKTIFSELEFSKFRQMIESHLVKFVEMHMLDMNSELSKFNDQSKQLPAYIRLFSSQKNTN